MKFVNNLKIWFETKYSSSKHNPKLYKHLKSLKVQIDNMELKINPDINLYSNLRAVIKANVGLKTFNTTKTFFYSDRIRERNNLAKAKVEANNLTCGEVIEARLIELVNEHKDSDNSTFQLFVLMLATGLRVNEIVESKIEPESKTHFKVSNLSKTKDKLKTIIKPTIFLTTNELISILGAYKEGIATGSIHHLNTLKRLNRYLKKVNLKSSHYLRKIFVAMAVKHHLPANTSPELFKINLLGHTGVGSLLNYTNLKII